MRVQHDGQGGPDEAGPGFLHHDRHGDGAGWRRRASAMFGGPYGPPGAGPWAAEGWGRGGWGGRGGRGRARRGDVRSAILALLSERPMHGYEIISELAQRTDNMWRPSAGSIYPTLQLLEDEGLVVGQTEAGTGKRRFSLTEQGRQAAAEVTSGPAPWEQVAAGTSGSTKELMRATAMLVPVVRQVVMMGSQRECEEAAKVIDETRRKLYEVLAGIGHPGPDQE